MYMLGRDDDDSAIPGISGSGREHELHTHFRPSQRREERSWQTLRWIFQYRQHPFSSHQQSSSISGTYLLQGI